MSILVWILFGLVVGLVARAIMPGRQPIGVVLTIILGVLGSLVGGLAGNALSGDALAFAPSGFILSVGGAVLLLFLAGLVKGPRRIA
jgi:uncharacterized membrane protein YeaQ/YmgE (transglycosylase-associated protein family)